MKLFQRRVSRSFASIAPCVCCVAIFAMAQEAQSGVVPPGGTFGGQSYTDLEVLWWQKALAIPVINDNHPFISGGAFDSGTGVTFLAGVGGGATIHIKVGGNQAIFFPIINAEASVLEPPPFHGDDEAEMRAVANAHIDATSGLYAEIDGVAVPNLLDYRIESPLFQFGPLPDNNLFSYFGLNAPQGTTSDSVDAGFYLLLTPLSRGQHTIHFTGTADDLGFTIDTTYIVDVVPEPSSFALAAIGLVGLGGIAWRKRRQAAREAIGV